MLLIIAFAAGAFLFGKSGDLPFAIAQGGGLRYDITPHGAVEIVSPTKPFAISVGYFCGSDNACLNEIDHFVKFSLSGTTLSSTQCIAQVFGAPTAPYIGTECVLGSDLFQGKTGKQTIKMEVTSCNRGTTDCRQMIAHCDGEPNYTRYGCDNITGAPPVWTFVGNVDVLVDETNCLDNPNCRIGECQACPDCPTCPISPNCPTCPVSPDCPTCPAGNELVSFLQQNIVLIAVIVGVIGAIFWMRRAKKK